jgi:hypothetical protein
MLMWGKPPQLSRSTGVERIRPERTRRNSCPLLWTLPLPLFLLLPADVVQAESPVAAKDDIISEHTPAASIR